VGSQVGGFCSWLKGQSGPDRSRGETLANDDATQSVNKGPEDIAVAQDKTQGKQAEIRAEAGSSS
jgi:hypothetical protein